MTTDHEWMRRAIDLALQCPPSTTAFSVGAVIVSSAGDEIATGYSRETGPHEHAEEAALAKAGGDLRLRTATLYSTLEPCSERASKPTSCTQLIISAGIERVVIAWREPSLFVADCVGVEQLRAQGIVVTELADLAGDAIAINGHLDSPSTRDG